MARKIIMWICIGLIIITGGTFVSMAFISVDYLPVYSNPSLIRVYKKGIQYTYSITSEKYSVIYDDLKVSFKQNSVDALFNGTLFKDYETVREDTVQTKSFNDGNWVNFHYNQPQTITDKYKQDVRTYEYDEMFIEVKTVDNLDLIVFYLGDANFSNQTFSYQYSFQTYGNINQLVEDLK